MPHLLDRAAVQEIADELVAVGSHRDQVAAPGRRRPEDLGRRVAERELRRDRQAGAPQPLRHAGQVGAVRLHLVRLGQLELVEIAGRPPVGDMDQQELGAQAVRQGRDVRHEGVIGASILQGD